eukprot:g16497.t1
MQLVVYYSGTAEDGVWSEGIIRNLEQTGGRCFEKTRVVYANLAEKDDYYPKGPSVMFYKMYLDDDVIRSFEDYAALAILEWDVVVAHPTSFERLYKAAFFTSEHFWVKGSTLKGAEFHDTAGVSQMWHILGHLNGNAIYNNADPAFNEFVNFTLNRWQYTYPYDVSLWATIADFPYSWPLWQRYSSKFVATQLIANVGFHDVSQAAVGMAISRDTLFIHGSTGGGGSTTNKAAVRAHRGRVVAESECKSACGSAATDATSDVVSTFCDPSCSPSWSSTGPRFDGHGCGADDPARFGQSCRHCFKSQEAALAEERRLSSAEVEGRATGVHVVMCSTENPPPASECSDECMSAPDTVCDYRCGSGVDPDLHCNWRGLGQTCRFCFEDPFEAYLADESAKLRGSRVILCATHEPPEAMLSGSASSQVDGGVVGSTKSSLELPLGDDSMAPDIGIMTANASTPYSGNITRGEMCAFMTGYFEFLPEIRVAVSSVTHFMAGMKVGIAASPTDFHVFNRTLGHLPTVNVVNSSRVEHASLNADKACGPDTRLIFYMEIGEVLSRTFTEKDTHTPRGDLIVSFIDIEPSNTECARRAMGTSILLGFSPPCFTYGSDLILPADLNEQLRGILRESKVLGPEEGALQVGQKATAEDDVDDELTGDLASIGALHRQHATVSIPEVLAALAYSQSPESLMFINPKQWSVENLFVHQSIWDVPLIKPRFGCNYDTSLSLSGYDLSERTAKDLESFKVGLKCERGFREVDSSDLNVKATHEFGVVGALQDLPDLVGFRISVMYRTFSGDMDFFEASISTVITHFPSALEVVVVVVEEDEALFGDTMDKYRSSAPFPLRLVTEPDLMDGHAQQKYSKLRADLYASGDYILHVDSNVFLLEDITYAHIFHIGKPVLPYRRYRRETPTGLHVALCWQDGTSFAVGEEVHHDFKIFNTHVFPRSIYPAARGFIEEYHQMSLEEFMSTRGGSCEVPTRMEKKTAEERNQMFHEFNFVGAFLWYHMRDAVHWIPADPWDIQPDQWRPNLSKFAWVCKADRRLTPKDELGIRQYIEDFSMVQNQRQCNIVQRHWSNPTMKKRSARTKIDTTSKEWTGG